MKIRLLTSVVTSFFCLFSFAANAVLGGQKLWIDESAEQHIVRSVTVRIGILAGDEFVPLCSGVAIGADEILSAGHCFIPSDLDDDLLMMVPALRSRGLLFVEVNDRRGWLKRSRVQIKNVYSRLDAEMDVALIKLARPLPENLHLRLAEDGCDDGQVLIAGYGKDEHGKLSSGVKVARYAKDFSTLKPDHLVNLEAFSAQSGKACMGDSGGPILCRSHGELVVLGVAARVARSFAYWLTPRPQADVAFCRQASLLYASTSDRFADQLKIWRALDAVEWQAPREVR